MNIEPTLTREEMEKWINERERRKQRYEHRQTIANMVGVVAAITTVTAMLILFFVLLTHR